MPDPQGTLAECRDCGLLQRLLELPEGAIATCSRCDALLQQSGRDALPLSLACAGVGLSLFALAFWSPVANVSMPGGRSATSALSTGPELLREAGAWELALAVTLTLLVFPGFQLAATLAMGAALWLNDIPLWIRRCFATLPALSSWAMVEVYMLGATISLVRLRAWMHVDFGPALYALGGVALCSVAVAGTLDRRAVWERVPLLDASPRRAAGSAWISCHGCDLVGRFEEAAPCPRCGRTLHSRKRNSVARTGALVIAAALLAIPANILPVMTIIKAGRGGPSTIIGGTLELVEHDFWLLALLVFVASVVVPVFKLIALCSLLLGASRASGRLKLRTKVFRAVSFIGRWSMLDIFATMTLVELARFGLLGNVRPEAGATAFCAVVVLTMLASDSFDPRLMWDAAGENHDPALARRAEWRLA